jgi:hypothetical protein
MEQVGGAPTCKKRINQKSKGFSEWRQTLKVMANRLVSKNNFLIGRLPFFRL